MKKRKRSFSPLNTVAILGAVVVVCMVYLGITSGVSIGQVPIDCVNFGPCSVTLSPTTSVNPVRTPHTVTATITPNSSGVPVFFIVTSGVNVGTEFGCTTVVGTGTTASCSSSYTPNNATSGVDAIQACGDFDATSAGVSDEIPATFAQCALDALGGEPGDVLSTGGSPSGIVWKTWLENFCTGGFKLNKGATNKPEYTGGFTFGANPLPDPASDFVGNVQIVKHGSALPCHFNIFTNLVFSGGPTTSPPSNHSICDVDIVGACKGTAVAGHFHVEDLGEPGKGVDKIGYTCTDIPVVAPNSCATLGSFTAPNPRVINGGNLQVHQIF